VLHLSVHCIRGGGSLMHSPIGAIDLTGGDEAQRVVVKIRKAIDTAMHPARCTNPNKQVSHATTLAKHGKMQACTLGFATPHLCSKTLPSP